MIKSLEREKPSTVGLLQALCVTVYCGLVALFFSFITKALPAPGFFGFFLMLILLVFSASVTGSLVFGYPAYLAIVKNKIKEGLTVLTYTLIFSFVIILVTVIFILTFLR